MITKTRQRNIGIGVVVAIALIAIGILTSRSDENVDVVHDVEPMSEAFLNFDQTLTALAEMETDERQVYLDRHYPNIDEDVVYWLRRDLRLMPSEQVRSVEFRFGSLEDVSAESGDGDRRNGFFENQLIATIQLVGGQHLEVILRCMNGMSASPDQLLTLQSMGSRTPVERFTIRRGEGLTHHVGFLAAIDIAERHGLPVYRGKRMRDRHMISYNDARALEQLTYDIQVTVYVVAGDEFNLVNLEFTPSPRRTSRRS